MRDLFSKELKEKLEIPDLYETDGKKDSEVIVRARYYDLFSSWEWYLFEADIQEDGTVLCFGLVNGHERELGYFSINEIVDINKKIPRIVRDEDFEPISFSKLKKKFQEPYKSYPTLED